MPRLPQGPLTHWEHCCSSCSQSWCSAARKGSCGNCGEVYCAGAECVLKSETQCPTCQEKMCPGCLRDHQGHYWGSCSESSSRDMLTCVECDTSICVRCSPKHAC